VLQERNDNR